MEGTQIETKKKKNIEEYLNREERLSVILYISFVQKLF